MHHRPIQRIDPRQSETQLLEQCLCVASGYPFVPVIQANANVFALASTLIRSQYPAEAQLLEEASQTYFEKNPDKRLDTASILKKGWIISLPRLKSMLTAHLQHKKSP